MNTEKKNQSLFLKIIPYLDRYGILILLLLMILALHILQPDVFLSWRNVTNVFKQISWQSMLALGVFMVIVTAGIDLSVGSIMMLSLMLLAIVAKAGMPWYIVVIVPMLAGLLCGMFNGLGITLLRMPHPFIMTLGTLYIFRGAGNLVSGGVPISGFTEEVRYLGHGRIDLTWLGLEESQRESLYAKFLKLPLYEDMAPWNIILSGPNMDYIDYDTRGITYDVEIPDAYKVMTALMNYERSVKDFHKCGSKARTIYGIPFISDCVGASFNQIDQDSMPKCGSDLAYPVPCIDGKCHSDYISCLKSMNNDENHRDGNGNNNSSMNDSEWWNAESDRIMSKSLLDNIFNGTSVYSLG